VQRRQPLEAAVWQRLAIELEAEVHANRPDWRLVAEAESRRRPDFAEVEVADAIEYVAGIDEPHHAEVLPDGHTQFRVEDDDGVAAKREPVAIDRLGRAQPVEGVPAHGRVATGEEPLTRWQVVHDLDDRLTVGPEDGITVGVHLRHAAIEACGQPDPRAAREDDTTAAGQTPVEEALREELHEAHFRSDEARSDVAVHSDKLSARRPERVVSRVANDRARNRRQAHLREEPIDERLIGRVVALVENLGALDYVPARQAQLAAKSPHQLEPRASPRVVEARTHPLLEKAGHEQVGLCVRDARCAIRPDEAVVLGGVAGWQRLALDRRGGG
jgi:hypothetical protein